MMRADANDYDQLALDYCAFGAYTEAAKIWQMAVDENAVTPMTRYYLAWAESRGGEIEDRRIVGLFEEAAAVVPDFCFPNRLEAILALTTAMEMNETDAHAPYFLGNLYYDKRQYDLAISLWEKSACLDADFPTVHRNLALAAFNKQHDAEKAVELMEQAFHLDETDARILMELDQLYKRLGRPHQERLDFLEKYPELIAKRDDLLLEEITLLNLTGRHAEAMKKLDAHRFHPWEGGEGKVPAQYQLSRVELAKQALANSKPRKPETSKPRGLENSEAVGLLEQCLTYPHHLGEGKLQGALDNDFLYLLGLAYERNGEKEKAKECWQRGTAAPMEPAAALYYNDAAPDKLFYAALCERALGNEDRARSRFNALISYGEKHLFDDIKPDYFAVSLPDLLVWDGNLNDTNRVHCLYMLALGHYGLGDKERSEKYRTEAMALNPNHLGLFAFSSFTKNI